MYLLMAYYYYYDVFLPSLVPRLLYHDTLLLLLNKHGVFILSCLLPQVTLLYPEPLESGPIKGDVEFDVKNRNSSIVFLYVKSKCDNFACVLLDQQEILWTLYLTWHRTRWVERLMACDQIETKIMKYHTLSGTGAVNLAKFYRKILLSSRSN